MLSEQLSTDLGDIQGLIVSGYGHLDHAAYWFLHFAAPGLSNRWLTDILPHITTSDWRGPGGLVEKPEVAVNLALTLHGLRTLGFPEESESSFPIEFRDGMTDPDRSRKLGDTGKSAPQRWDIGSPASEADTPSDVLLILQAPTAGRMGELVKTLQALNESTSVEPVVPLQLGTVLSTEREHFGFVDGISQPVMNGSPGRSHAVQDNVPAGEFVLGYLNAYQMLPATATVSARADPHNLLPNIQHRGEDRTKDFGRNGTYVVFRKLYQDVAGFRRYLREHGSSENALLAAKMVGRWPSGAPLVFAPTADDPAFTTSNLNNSFMYKADDPDGLRCPIGSHIRRANPRDGLETDPAQSLLTVSRHRLLRRGVPYGPSLDEGVVEDDGKDRGLLFLCLNADIKRQFEFVQQTWINNPKFGGLYEDRDPLVGNNIDDAAPDTAPRNMTIQRVPFRQRYTELPRFVHVRGGGYFFMPGMAALRFLGTISQGEKGG